MKVLLINSVCGIRSTGRICTDIASEMEKQGHEVRIAYGRMEEVPLQAQRYAVRIGTDLDVRKHALRTRILDDHGFGSGKATKRFLTWAESYDPDLVWLHNIHGYYINVEMLFDWIKSRPEMEVKWTLHDCWAFTGHCTHFDYSDCSKWKTGCENCPQKKDYPSSLFRDHSRVNYQRKIAAFSGVKNMTLITPSKWMADLVQQSFLKDYPVKVVFNTINTEAFRPTPSDFRKKHGLENKKIILGVASAWSTRKGLQDFIALSQYLGMDEVIVLVGLDDKQMKEIPAQILGIRRTNSVQELAQIYTAADVFFNPTYEDNYPTVNLEAQACGTRVITYRTGGAPETLYAADAVVIPKGEYRRVLEIVSAQKEKRI